MNMRGFICGLVFSITLSLLAAAPTFAQEADALWPVSGKFTVNQTQSIDYDATKLCTQQTIKTIYYLNGPVTERDVCVSETAYGTVANGKYLKRYVGDYVQLTVNAIPVPNTSKMYALQCGYPCRLVSYDTRQGFSGSTSDYGYRLTPKADAVPIMHPTIDENIAVVSLGYSQNGRWLAIQTNGGFYRYDTETSQFVKFSEPRGSYGVGRDPSFVYSITDDGRYIALSGSNYGDAFVFDLEGCSSRSSGSPVRLLGATCDAIELRRIINANGYYVSALYGVALRAGGKQIIAYGPDSSSNNKGYIGRLNGLASRADYIALGDSFSSGEGDIRDNTRYLNGTDGTIEYPKEKCHVSSRSYPFLLQKQNTDQKFVKSFACSGAETVEIMEAEDKHLGQFKQLDGVNEIRIRSAFKSISYNSDISGRIPQYRFIEKYQPKNITITIGGNDAGFGNVIEACFWSGTCEFESVERGAKGLEMQSKYQVLRDTYRKIRNSSPDSNLYVLSYPQFIDDNNQCNPNVGLNQAERTFVRKSVSYFNKVIRQAALAEGATYLDIEDSLKGEALCSPKLLNLAVNGLVEGNDIKRVIGQESFHPNSRGHELIASYIKANYGAFPDLDGETCSETSCSNYKAPAVPSYFNVLPSTVERYKFALINEAKELYKRGTEIKISLQNFIPHGTGRVSIHSTPRDLGPVMADANGKYEATVTIPADMVPGYHELHLQTTSLDGRSISYYQSITVIATETDYDGDGILNEADTCGFIKLAGVDVDRDGIDDACDGIIGLQQSTKEVGGRNESMPPSRSDPSVSSQAPASDTPGDTSANIIVANADTTEEIIAFSNTGNVYDEQVAGTRDTVQSNTHQQAATISEESLLPIKEIGIVAGFSILAVGGSLLVKRMRRLTK